MSAITALTAQNTQGVQRHPPGAAGVRGRADRGGARGHRRGCGQDRDALLRRTDPHGRGRAARFGARNIVLDPVMVAQSGDRLLRDDAVGAIPEYLMPLTDVVTPNLPEAEVLVGPPRPHARGHAGGRTRSRPPRRAQHPDQGRPRRGGRQHGPALPLHGRTGWCICPAERIPTRNNHGTGCTLSSAIAAFLARGEALEPAVRQAKDYISRRHPRRRGLPAGARAWAGAPLLRSGGEGKS